MQLAIDLAEDRLSNRAALFGARCQLVSQIKIVPEAIREMLRIKNAVPRIYWR